ncbi:MAG: SIR2 family protein [Betaproteobacteria bacterium]|nr:SIR2 family protein [Betaproteobacteria bacterium]
MLTPQQLDELRASLFAGHYNLLLGSGASLDSTDKVHKPLMGATELTTTLCTIKSAKPGTTLSRVSSLLTPEEITKHLTDRYSGCHPGDTVKKVTNFVWKTAFTFNIDDSLESAYEKTLKPKQAIEPLNYDSAYETPSNRSRLPIVHLHGFVREPEKGYVFSVPEYGRVTRGLNPWMHVLSELLSSEPFIISGTSLNESDLEFYLSGRSETSPRKNRGPSILVEPFPDAVTENDCHRHSLILVKSTLKEFLVWLVENLGNPPTVAQLVVPPVENIFSPSPPAVEQVAFFSAFQLVRPVSPNPEGTPSPFLYGQPPKWSDLESALDVPTKQDLILGTKSRLHLESKTTEKTVLCLLADPGTGKTTCLRRVAYDLAREGKIVFLLTSRAALEIEAIVSCLALISRPFAIVIDAIADQTSFVRSILTNPKIIKPFVIICADRKYRRDHIDRLLGDLSIEYIDIEDWPQAEILRLIEKYRMNGLLGEPDAIRHPEKFGRSLLGEPVAICTCRILNNFKPLETIIKSLWNDATESERRSYAIAAVAEHCYAGGLYYPILEAAQHNSGLRNQITYDCPLPLAFSEDDDYILPFHALIADRTLLLLSRERENILFEVFVNLADALAPYVNRRTIIDQTPESRLAGRLFHADRVVRPLLGELSEQFYKKTQDRWQWNSRYWEQRALLTQTIAIDTAVQYARHAVAIEAHPFPWTTLATILIRKLEGSPGQRDSLFTEAIDLLNEVFKFEERRNWRPTPHPYSVLVHAVTIFLDQNGKLSPKREDWIIQQINKTNELFPRDTAILSGGASILERLKKAKC